MKQNADKFHLVTFVVKNDKMKLHIGEAVIEENDKETLLGINARYKA